MTPLKPMLCLNAPGKPPRLPGGDGWIIEPKLDGWRFIFHVTSEGVRSYGGRNGADWTGSGALPAVEVELAFLPDDTILDAELIVPESPTAGAVSGALGKRAAGNLQAVVFDVLRIAGTDTTGLPWERRRELLEKAAEGFDGERLRIMPYHDKDEQLHQSWLEQGLEGSVAKQRTSPYRPGSRTKEWTKIKPQTTDEAIIVGTVEGQNGWAGKVGAFMLQMIDSGATTTCAVPDDEVQADVTADPDKWLGRVIELRHHGLMPSGKPQHPVYHRLRPDRQESA